MKNRHSFEVFLTDHAPNTPRGLFVITINRRPESPKTRVEWFLLVMPHVNKLNNYGGGYIEVEGEIEEGKMMNAGLEVAKVKIVEYLEDLRKKAGNPEPTSEPVVDNSSMKRLMRLWLHDEGHKEITMMRRVTVCPPLKDELAKIVILPGRKSDIKSPYGDQEQTGSQNC